MISVYAPQSGLSDSVKDAFYDDLLSVVPKLGIEELVLVAGDLNGHVGKFANGYEGVHGGFGYGNRNPEGERILEFCEATHMMVANTLFKKRESRLVTYQSGNSSSQIDYILVRKTHRKFVRDVKVIAGEECVTQHRLVVCDLSVKSVNKAKRPSVARRKVWKLEKAVAREEFSAVVRQKLTCSDKGIGVDDQWSTLKCCLLEATDSVCGWTTGRVRRRVTWWWNDEVDRAVKEKRKLWKDWKVGGSKERYLEAKRVAKSKVYAAKKEAEVRNFQNILTRDDEKEMVFKIAKQVVRTNQDVVGEGFVRDDNGELAISDSAMKEAWRSYYSQLLNEEFDWDHDSLSHADPIEGPAVKIEREKLGRKSHCWYEVWKGCWSIWCSSRDAEGLG